MRLLPIVLLAGSPFLAGTAFQDQAFPVDSPRFRVNCTDLATVRPTDREFWERLEPVEMTPEQALEIVREYVLKKGYEEMHILSCELTLVDKPYYTVELFTKSERKVEEGDVSVVEQKPTYFHWEARVGLKLRGVKFWTRLYRFPGTAIDGEVTTLPSGVMFSDVRLGDGQAIEENSTVKVHYTMMTLEDVMVFDTYSRGEPQTFALADAPVPGLREGLLGARVGGKRKVIVPPGQAWGATGLAGLVPPNATVIFDVETKNVR